METAGSDGVSVLGRIALGLFGLVVLGLAVRTVRNSPALTWVSVGLGIPAIALTVAEAVDPTRPDPSGDRPGLSRGPRRLLLLHGVLR